MASLMVCCPLTTAIKGYPFEVLVTDEIGRPAAVLADQVKSLDWRLRKASKKGAIPADALAEVKGKIKALLALS